MEGRAQARMERIAWGIVLRRESARGEAGHRGGTSRGRRGPLRGSSLWESTCAKGGGK